MSVIAQADCIKLPFPSTYFHAIITSPPYLGLRKYEGDQVKTWRSGGYQPMTGADHIKVDEWVGPLGGEPSVELYVFHLILVCREIRRVLRDDGVFWLVLSDSYNGSGGAGGDYRTGGLREGQPTYPGRSFSQLQSGDLIGVPQRVWLALQADGWIMRNEVIWSKKPLPEPRKGWRYDKPPCNCVKDRREEMIAEQMHDQGTPRHRTYSKPGDIRPDPDCPTCGGIGYAGDLRLYQWSWRHTRSHESILMFSKNMGYYSNHMAVAEGLKNTNPRDVQEFQRDNYSGKHFAVYPPALVAHLLKVSVPRYCCSICSKPWSPVIKRVEYGTQYLHLYRSSCEHGDDNKAPGRVLDPFIGSGTTGKVASEHGKQFAGTDVSFKYLTEQAMWRALRQVPPSQQDVSDLPLFSEG